MINFGVRLIFGFIDLFRPPLFLRDQGGKAWSWARSLVAWTVQFSPLAFERERRRMRKGLVPLTLHEAAAVFEKQDWIQAISPMRLLHQPARPPPAPPCQTIGQHPLLLSI